MWDKMNKIKWTDRFSTSLVQIQFMKLFLVAVLPNSADIEAVSLLLVAYTISNIVTKTSGIPVFNHND